VAPLPTARQRFDWSVGRSVVYARRVEPSESVYRPPAEIPPSSGPWLHPIWIGALILYELSQIPRALAFAGAPSAYAFGQLVGGAVLVPLLAVGIGWIARVRPRPAGSAYAA
jgi:hypothetical protein